MDLQEIKGLGPKSKQILQGLGIFQVEDLLWDFPRRYEDLTKLSDLSAAQDGDRVLVRAQLSKVYPPVYRAGRRSILRAQAVLQEDGAKAEESEEDPSEDNTFPIFWYNQAYLARNLRRGDSFYFYGFWKKDPDKDQGRLVNPKMIPLSEAEKELDFFSLHPVYRLGEGLTNRKRTDFTRQALEKIDLDQGDWLPQAWRKDFYRLSDSIRALHFPKDWEALRAGRKDLAYRRDLLDYLVEKEIARKREETPSVPLQKVDLAPFLDLLPFSLSKDQAQALDKLAQKLYAPQAMNALLQGDVGSGKTVLAFALAYIALKNGYSVAMMAPTEILAAQHAQKAQALFSKLGFSVFLLTGSDRRQDRMELEDFVQSGQAGFFLGTHALFQKDVTFPRLALVMTDEQHRFGVRQRQALQAKGKEVNVLVFSATPIPRTLSLVYWGDLDLVRLENPPLGKKPIVTRVLQARDEKAIFAGLLRQLRLGQQIYLVCPLIEAGDSDLASWSVEALYGRLKKYLQAQAPHYLPYLASLTGRQKSEEKEAVMAAFHAGRKRILLSTTVVEVGVDVAQASVMVIFAAERFGLAQIHQLRGRVGRGKSQGYCLLVAAKASQEAMDRLHYMESHTNGLEIAKKDLLLRGAGDRFGESQHGFFFAEDWEGTKEARMAWAKAYLQEKEGDLPLEALPPSLAEKVGEKIQEIQWMRRN